MKKDAEAALDWLDEGSKEILRPVLDHEGDEPKAVKTMRLSLAVRPVECAKVVADRDPQRLDSLLKGDFPARVPMFVSRYTFYAILWNDWMERIQKDGGPVYENPVNAFHSLAPLFVQELEGPLRYNLAALIDLLDTAETGEGDWYPALFKIEDEEVQRKHYFDEMLEDAIDRCEEAEETMLPDDWLRTGLRFLRLESSIFEEAGWSGEAIPPKMNHVRNAIAHSDYHMTKEDDSVHVVLHLRNGTRKRPLAVIFPWLRSHFLLAMSLTMGIAGALHVASQGSGDGAISQRILNATQLNYPT